MTEQLILRYRDIELQLNETMREHQRIITSSGGVWWGWLYRSYEAIPAEFLSEFQGKVRSQGSVEMYLYDTGQGKLFLSAKCEGVEFAQYPESSPDIRRTPAYYNNRESPAWFLLTDIAEVQASDVVGRTCVSMPSASEDCAIDLEGVTVTKLSDLRRQEVTMWVVGDESSNGHDKR